MIGLLRHGLNTNIYRCSKLVNRQVYLDLGFDRSLQYVGLRLAHKGQCEGLVGAKRPDPCANREILKAKDCQKPPPPPPPPGCPDEEKGKSRFWLLALLAAGAAGFLIWYLRRKDGKELKEEKPKEPAIPVYGVKVPASSADIPNSVPYLLIGGGTASFSAFRAIKSHDPKAKVLMITNEYHKPYMRPPLSKELWYHAEPGQLPKDFRFKQWNGAERSLFYEADEFYVDPVKLMETENGGIAVCQGYHVKKVDSCNQEITLTDGKKITYNKCLIATGCSPKTLEVFESAPRSMKENISKFRTPFDYERLKKICDTKGSIVIVGSGFLGSELACALAQYGRDKDVKIYQVFHESGNMAKVLPEYLSKWTTKQVQEQGVCVIPQAQVSEVSSVHNHIKLDLSNGQSILTDHVVLCVGCEANTELAGPSGLEVDYKLGGFVVNAELEARRHLFVAGDAACFYDPLLGRRRVEHHDHSVVSGRLAGENMVGLRKPYTHQSMFWSDLGPEIGYEGIGIIDASLPTVGVFAKASLEDLKRTESHLEAVSFQQKDKTVENISDSGFSEREESTIRVREEHKEGDHFGKGVVFYLKGEKVVGILLWNLFNRINLARQVINENKTFDDLNEVAKLFEIHS